MAGVGSGERVGQGDGGDRRRGGARTVGRELVPTSEGEQQRAARGLIHRNPEVTFIVFASLWSVLFWSLAARLQSGGEGRPADPSKVAIARLLSGVGTLGPTVTAFMLSATLDGEFGIQRLLHRLFMAPTTAWVWAAVAVPWITHAVLWAWWRADQREVELAWVDALARCARRVVPALATAAGQAMGEEFGFRGFLLPSLLRRTSVHRSALVVGATWAAWQCVPFCLGLSLGYAAPAQLFPVHALSMVPFSIASTLAFVHSRGGLFPSFILTLSITMSSIMFGEPLYTGTGESRLFFGFACVALANAVALPAYIASMRQRHDRRRWSPFGYDAIGEAGPDSGEEEGEDVRLRGGGTGHQTVGSSGQAKPGAAGVSSRGRSTEERLGVNARHRKPGAPSTHAAT